MIFAYPSVSVKQLVSPVYQFPHMIFFRITAVTSLSYPCCCAGIETIGILNVVSIFVIIGIGVDDVFVFINTFKQSKGLKNMRSLEDRLIYTIREATKATFFTSITTSIAFFANAISSVSDL